MHLIQLNDGTIFDCESHETIIEGALRNDILLDHSCLKGRCSSCKFKVLEGNSTTDIEEVSLSQVEKDNNYVLTCVRKPTSNLTIDAENLNQYGFSKSSTVPSKINSIQQLTSEMISVKLRVPPTYKLEFLEGQYLNVIWNGIKRSYSIASPKSSELELIIKNYPNGKMSEYWFNHAKINDLLRLEIPKGTFFLRNHLELENIVFLATGTGIAPIKAILESKSNQQKLSAYQNLILLWGMKHKEDLFWQPELSSVDFIPVLSREIQPKHYVQDLLKSLDVDWKKTAVYACGSDDMIHEAKKETIKLGIKQRYFYSDAFVASN